MEKLIINIMLSATLLFGGYVVTAQKKSSITMLTEKKNIGKQMALYPMPLTVVGTEVDGKVNWLLVAHVGIIGHDRILVSMSKSHYSNQGIVASKRLSVNLVNQKMLPKADYVGSVSGKTADKSDVFDYHYGENGTPIIDASPLSIECDVVDIYETEGFDNFICSIANTYADLHVLNEKGRLDYTKLKPVLFEFPTYSYVSTGNVIGKCLNLNDSTSACWKEAMTSTGIVRLSKVEVFPQFLTEYKQLANEIGEVSLRTEPGVLAMYALSDKNSSNMVTILEIYSSSEAYEAHISSAHFKKYKQETASMVKNLQLCDQNPLNPTSIIDNYIKD